VAFDSLVTNAGRLRILTALAAEPAQPFVRLRRATGLTDGNLATHARRLQSAGLVAIEKSITDGKPLTTLHLTSSGRDALASHARALLEALAPPPTDPPRPETNDGVDPDVPVAHTPDVEDDWVD
jgi:DNA-binding MarR family transcriptional regulator